MERAGLREMRYLLTAGGIVAIHAGTVRRGHRRGGRRRAYGAVRARRPASLPREVDGLEAIMQRGGESLRGADGSAPSVHLERVTAEAGTPLASHANATVIAGGKRLRPLLVVLAAESAGGPPQTRDGEERLVRAAVAVELVHSATLVHDDLIDGALLRRGHPTVASVAGRQMAVATGDLLFSRAFAELALNGDVAQLRALSDASSALAEGELLQREDAYAAHVAVERYLRRCELKTAALFEAACRLGALTAARRLAGSWPTRSARSPGASAWPFRCSTTCSTCPARSSARASHAAPICSTAPSPCRSSSRANVTPSWPRSTSPR